ncbi:MAG: hypothetical protein NTV56_02245, partial [Alphaproteobacteria bacterium]|nr:hypothetical protein [Alphaproteobacteria bacterium]
IQSNAGNVWTIASGVVPRIHLHFEHMKYTESAQYNQRRSICAEFMIFAQSQIPDDRASARAKAEPLQPLPTDHQINSAPSQPCQAKSR